MIIPFFENMLNKRSKFINGGKNIKNDLLSDGRNLIEEKMGIVWANNSLGIIRTICSSIEMLIINYGINAVD